LAADAVAAADRAMGALRQAIAAGYRDVNQLRKDHDLMPLSARADFQLLMLDVSMPADSFAVAR
jgi:hypothetical protein